MDLFSIDIGDCEVAYGAAGTIANPPLVFVHGWAMSHSCWRDTIPEFYLRYRCLGVDLPGFGWSEKPAWDYSIPSLAAYLRRFLDALGIECCDLVGHSMGGLTSLLFSLENPERVRRLCVVNPPMSGSTALTRLVWWATQPGIRTLAYLGSRTRWGLRYAAKKITYVFPLPDDVVEAAGRATYRSMIQTALSIKATDLVPRLPELRMPALLVGCDRDTVVRPEEHAHWPPDFQYVRMVETGHFPMIERPSEFNQILRSFLEAPSQTAVVETLQGVSP